MAPRDNTVWSLSANPSGSGSAGSGSSGSDSSGVEGSATTTPGSDASAHKQQSTTLPHAPAPHGDPDDAPAAAETSLDGRLAALSTDLRAAHARLSLFASSSLMGQLVHRGGVLLDANDRFLDMTGYPRDELVGKPIVDVVVDPESRELIARRIELGLDGTYFAMGLHRKGHRFPIELDVRRGIFEGEDARVVTVRDISEQASDLARLRTLEQRLFQVMELAFDATILVEQGVVSYACAGALRLLERPSDTLLGSHWAQLLGPSLNAGFSSLTPAQSMPPSSVSRSAGGTVPVRVTRHHRALVLPDGRLLPAECVELPAIVGGRDVQLWGLRRSTVSMMTPSSHAAAVHKQQWDDQKADTVALLAAGLSHDVNNLLVGVLGNADLAESALQAGEDVADYIRAMRVAAERASELTTRMMRYASDNEMTARPIDLNTLVDETISLARVGTSKAVAVTKSTDRSEETDPSALFVNGDPGRLGQVVLNLIMNAVDAMGAGNGTVRLELSQCSGVPSDAIERPVEPASHFIKLSVRDEGVGMDPTTVRQAFEPFFSTKREGRGLGLATSLSIVRQHRGGLTVTSRVGLGTCIDVYLPKMQTSASTSAGAARLTTPARADAGWRTQGRVLVIDDEAMVARLTGMVLEHFGLSPTIEHSGRSGLARLRETMSEGSSEPFRLVLVDFTMPDMSGNEVLEQVRRLAPNVPVVLTSGFSHREVQSRGVSPSFTGFLQKPYRMATMVEVLKAALQPTERTGSVR